MNRNYRFVIYDGSSAPVWLALCQRAILRRIRTIDWNPGLWLSALVMMAFVMLAGSVSAADLLLDARMKKVLADPAAVTTAITGAKKYTFFCEVCHGADGISQKGDVPNLAQQNSSYLLTQIDKFSRGQRKYKFMEDSMKLLTAEDKIDLAVYFSTRQVKPAGNQTSAAGGVLFTDHCSVCHLAKAQGNETTPRLAGQQPQYLSQSIHRYRDRTGERIYEPMSAMTASLKDPEIQALTVYLSSLK